jgi:pimeloyl-ACP methyl ester carboxylesterase
MELLLAHDDVGAGGHPVLLLHAGVADRRMWDPVTPALSHVHRVVRADLRGFGGTPLPPGPYRDADDVAALLDHLGVPEAAVVGASFGGRVAMELATLHPDRVSSLVLLCPAFRGLEASGSVLEFGEREDALLEAGDVEGAVALNVETWLGPEADAATREALAGWQRHAFEVQLEADRQAEFPQPRPVPVDPADIAVPTTVVSGALDLEHFRAVADLLVERIEGAEGVRLSWAAHLPSLERPDAVQALLLDVLRGDPNVHAP